MSDQEIFRQRGAYLVPDVAPPLDASYGDKWTGDQYCFRDGFFVYENHAQDSRVREMGDVCSTVSAKYGTGGGNTPIVVFTQNDAGRDAAVDVAPTLRSGHGGGAVNQCVCLPVDIRNAIRQSDNDVTGKGWGDVGDPMYTLTAGGKIPDVCYGLYENQRAEMRLYDGVQPTVSCGGGKAGQGNNMILVCNPVYHFVVRRLTPRECERLQGFPDDWTLIPWRGKPAEDCPDSHRYKAVGNSMAVPVMWYIGRRIQIVERRMAA